jgi:hypothetical protein
MYPFLKFHNKATKWKPVHSHSSFPIEMCQVHRSEETDLDIRSCSAISSQYIEKSNAKMKGLLHKKAHSRHYVK